MLEEDAEAIDACRLEYNVIDFKGLSNLLRRGRTTWRADSTHPEWPIERQMPLYVCYIELFGDDVSGAVSKQWNKHYCVYMTLRNLPREMLSHNYFVHFISASKEFTIPEQLASISKMIEATQREPMITWDSLENRQVRLRFEVISIVSDNPMASEIIDHIGQKGNHFCRRCEVGGTLQARQSDEGYHKLFTSGPKRTKEGNLVQLKKQAILAIKAELKITGAKLQLKSRKDSNRRQRSILHGKAVVNGHQPGRSAGKYVNDRL